jgi:hypothetical protein
LEEVLSGVVFVREGLARRVEDERAGRGVLLVVVCMCPRLLCLARTEGRDVDGSIRFVGIAKIRKT